MPKGRSSALIGSIALTLALLASPAVAPAQDPGPAYTDWNPDQIGFLSNADPSRRANCAEGYDECIDRTIAEMYRRYHEVVPVCDDNNVFSLT